MRRAVRFWRCAGMVILGLAALAGPERAEALTIRFESLDIADATPGEDLRQVRYHVSGDVNGSPFQADQGFAIEFALTRYRGLQDPPPAVNADWDALVLQPDPGIPDDGTYDALALVDDPSLADPFVVTFVWLGIEAPGSQPFTVNQFDAAGNLVAVLQVGETESFAQAVPQAATSVLIGAGLLALASLVIVRSFITALVTTLALVLSLNSSVSEASPTIGSYVLVGEQRVSRTHSDFTYTAGLGNDGEALTNVHATLTSVPAGVTVVEGSLSFGNVAAGAGVRSTDTFTVRIDRRIAFNSSGLVWTLHSTPDNSAPVANAGADDTALVGDAVSLNGAGSTDVDGDTLTFAWSIVSRPAGSAATVQFPGSVTPTFVIDQPGTYVILLVVNDGLADSAPDTVSVSTLNSPPVANAGPDQLTVVGSVVQLSGGGSTDVDGNPLTFAWSLTIRPAGSFAALSSSGVLAPTFVVDQPGTYVAQLIVNDGSVDSAPDTVMVTTQNRPPTADAGPDQSVVIGATVQLNGSGSTDVDGNPLTFTWSLTAVPTGSTAVLLTPTASNSTFRADRPGTYVAQLIVNDGALNSAPDTVTVSTQNSTPTADAGADQSVTQGETVQLDGSGSSDPDGTPLQFFWSLTTRPAGSTAGLSSSSTVDPTFVADRAGTYIAQLIVSDAVLNSVPDTVSVTAAPVTPLVTILAIDQNAAEAGPDLGTFRFTRTGDLAAPLTVTYTVGGSATNGTDYGVIGTSIVIPAGEPSADLTITPIDDADQEGDETVVVAVVAGAGYSLGTPRTATVTIIENDLPTVTAVATDADAAEAGPDTGTFTFTRTGPTTLGLIVTITIGGTATAGSDYFSLSTTVTIPSGQASVTRVVTPVADALLEGNETVVVTLAPGQYVIGPPSSATVTIADSVPTVTVVATDPAAAEAGPNTGTFTFTRTGPTTLALIVSITIGGTATAGSDYFTLSTTVTIPSGQDSVTRVVTPVADALLEGNETVVATLAPGQYVIGTPSSATVTIADSVPTVTVVATDPAAAEAGPNTGTFTFTRTGPTTVALTVRITIGGTATAGSDYFTLSTTVTIPSGQASVTRLVTPVDDAAVEANETVVVTLASGQYVIGTPNTATVTITSND